MEKELLEILACPICKGKLIYKAKEQKLVCRYDKLAYPIQDGIPIMLEDQAKKLLEEV